MTLKITKRMRCDAKDQGLSRPTIETKFYNVFDFIFVKTFKYSIKFLDTFYFVSCFYYYYYYYLSLLME